MNTINNFQNTIKNPLIQSALPTPVWDLRTVKYNGVTFVSFAPQSSVQSALGLAKSVADMFNVNLNQAVNQGLSTLGIKKQLDGGDPNSIMPYNTFTALLQQKNSLQKKVSIHLLPNTDINYITDQGCGPEYFYGVGMVSGDNYYNVWSNLRKAYTANQAKDANINPKDFHVFCNYDGRIIQNAIMTNLQEMVSSVKNTIIFTYEVVASKFSNLAQKTASNILQKINDALNLIIGFKKTIDTFIAELKSLKNNASRIFGKNTRNAMIFIADSNQPNGNSGLARVANATNLALSISTILYNNFAPQEYQNLYFDNYAIDYNKFPIISGYSVTKSKDSISGMLKYYTEYVDSTLDQIIKLKISQELVDLCNELIRSKGIIINLAKIITNNILNDTYLYSVPYDMGIITLCQLNGFDWNNLLLLDAIFQDNKSNYDFSVIEIKKGTNVILRKSY